MPEPKAKTKFINERVFIKIEKQDVMVVPCGQDESTLQHNFAEAFETKQVTISELDFNDGITGTLEAISDEISDTPEVLKAVGYVKIYPIEMTQKATQHAARELVINEYGTFAR
jgi:hypothetical protein